MAAGRPGSPSPVHPILGGRGARAALERGAEFALFLLAASIILVVFLIFAFVAKNAWGVFVQKTTTAAPVEVIQPDEASSVSPERLAKYLGLESAGELDEFDEETIQFLLESAAEEAEKKASPDGAVNALSYENMLMPRVWSGGASKEPAYVWQPVGDIPKYNIAPLFVGSLKATIVAMLFAAPIAFIAALYVSQFAAPKLRRTLKPAIELLSGIPSVVLGMFALMVLATAARRLFGFEARLNATVAGIGLGLAVIPIVFTVMEDVLSSVPRSYRDASLALGANPWQTSIKVVVPAALPGLFAALVLGFGRAIGETMIVLMASGNAPLMSWNLADPIRTVTATIAAELPDAQFGDHHYQALFFLGALLFLVTFAVNFCGDVVVHRMKRRLEGR